MIGNLDTRVPESPLDTKSLGLANKNEMLNVNFDFFD